MIRVGIVGKRGLSHRNGIESMRGVKVVAFCDADPSTWGDARADGIDLKTEYFEDLLPQVDAVFVSTPMHVHAAQVVRSLHAGKHVLCEVTLGVNEAECIAILAACKHAPKRFMFAENYCYFRENLLVEQLVREGKFGALTFAEAAYLHEVRFLRQLPSGEATWREHWQLGIRGNTYITHELGPLMRRFRLADPSVTITSVACHGTGAKVDPTLRGDDTTVTTITLSNGALIVIRLDLMSNRPHEIYFMLQGAKGAYDSRGSRIWLGEDRPGMHREWQSLSEIEVNLPDERWLDLAAAEASDHAGADYLVGLEWSRSMHENRMPEIGCQEAIEWTMAGILSQRSVLKGGRPVAMPEWVYGDWRQLRMRLGLADRRYTRDPQARVLNEQDAPALARLLSRAFPEIEWNLERVLRDPLQLKTCNATFGIFEDKQLVATASSVTQPHAPNQGYVHWVATDPEFVGKGYGRRVTECVLADFQERAYPTCILETDDFRHDAIRLYLKMGFVPEYSHETHEARWRFLSDYRP